MFKKIGSAFLTFVLAVSVFPIEGFTAENTLFAKWAPWSFYETENTNDFEDFENVDLCVPVSPEYRSSNSIKPGLIVKNGDSAAYMYIRPEIEWNVKIADNVKECAAFYPSAEKGTAVGFTAPEDGVYSIYAKAINDFGNDKSDTQGDGGAARVTVLKDGETSENAENSEDFLIPKTGATAETFEKSAFSLSAGDRIMLRVSGGEKTEGDCFQIVWRITLENADGSAKKVYNLRDPVDNFSENSGGGVQGAIDKSVMSYDDNAPGSTEDNGSAAFLAGLGIIGSDEIGSYLLEKNITRAEFAKLIAGLMNVEDSGKKQSDYFTDVEEENKPAFIDALAAEGIISKARTFRPNDEITKAEAATIMVNLLGYKKYAEFLGGYPNGYINEAYSLKLIPKGVGDKFSRIEAVTMVAAMCDVYVTDYAGSVGEDTVLNNHSKRTILNIRHNIYYDEGIVTKVPNASLNKGSAGLENRVEIDGEDYKSELDLADMLGNSIEFYYRKADDENVLLYFKAAKRSQIVNIEGADIETISTDLITYYEENKTKKYKIDSKADFLYNGKAGGLTGDLKSLINQDSEVSLTDRDGDGLYDVVNIKSYENYVVELADSVNMLITDKLTEQIIEMDAAPETVFKMSDGNSAAFSDIKSGNIISVYRTLDDEVMSVVISEETVSGQLTRKKDEGGYKSAFLDGEEYIVAENFETGFDTYVQSGDYCTVYLDACGHAAYIKANYVNRFGYLKKVSCEENDADTLAFKIITSDGTTVLFSGAKTIEYNGIKISREDIYSTINLEYADGNYKGMIRYKTSGGKLKSITMPDYLISTYYSNSLKYHSGSGNLGGRIIVDENTMLFQIPDEVGESRGERPKVVKAKTGLVHFASYSGITSVKTDRNSIVSDVIMIKGSGAKTLDEKQYPLLVSEINEFIDENDEKRMRVNGYRNGELVEYITETESTLKDVRGYYSTDSARYDIGVGDVILTALEGNTIVYAEIDFDASAKKKVGPNPYTDYLGKTRLYYASVYSMSGEYMRVTTDLESVINEDDLEIQGVNKIYIIDLSKSKKQVTEGSYSDIIPYKTKSGAINSNYTRAVFSTMEVPDAIYIYK